MGCDIHLYKEKRVNGQWVTCEKWIDKYNEGYLDVNWEERYTDRNYNLFGLLAEGVRTDHELAFPCRGVPHNACPEYQALVKRWGVDGHSHSYLYLDELKELLERLKSSKTCIKGMMDAGQWKELQEEAKKENPDWDKLFPYCKWTNRNDYVNFQVDVPSSYMVGQAVEKIIKSFDGIDGDNHRIVFFFDN